MVINPLLRIKRANILSSVRNNQCNRFNLLHYVSRLEIFKNKRDALAEERDAMIIKVKDGVAQNDVLSKALKKLEFQHTLQKNLDNLSKSTTV